MTVTPDWREAELHARLDEIRAANLERRRRVIDGYVDGSAGSVRPIVDGRELLSFCSNDYLGLARDARVAESFASAARRWGAGSGASHLVTGHHAEHHALEEELAAFTGRPRAVLFSTGYMANLALAVTLLGRRGRVLEDRLNHASLLDAGWLSGAEFARYPHNDAAAAARLLARRGATGDAAEGDAAEGGAAEGDAAEGGAPDGSARASATRRGDARATDGAALVLTDGVFSMDGDVAPLPALARACREHRAWLAVDDAHGLGTIGVRGGGSLARHGCTLDDVPVLVGTLGKAFGTFGAFVAGSDALVELFVQKARTYIYTTALPPAVAAATRTALAIARDEEWRRERLAAHVARFRTGVRELGLALLDSDTPIQPVILGDAAAALAASDALRARGILVSAIRPPTVPAGSSRLRITFSAAHESADVDRLLEALASVCATAGASARASTGAPAREPASRGAA